MKKTFPLYFSHNRKAKFMVLDRAIARATLELYAVPRRRYIEIIRRSDEKIIALVMRRKNGLMIEWFRKGVKKEDLLIPTTRKPKQPSMNSEHSLYVH